MANKKPFDFTNHKEINIFDVLVEYKKSELHHIFPQKSEVGKKLGDDINSILNICFLPRSSNQSIHNDNPSIYFLKKVKEKNAHYLEDIESNLITSDSVSGVWDNNFEKMLKQRAELITAEISRLTLAP